MKKRIIISGGGTGGHVFPAIAIANALKKIDDNIEILFVGAKGKIEMEKVPKAGYPIKGLWISGIQRKLTVKNLWLNFVFIFKLISSLWTSFWIVKRFKPQAAVGVGGYASGPVLQIASMRGIPSLIQEQNSFPGITNRLLAKRVDKICVVYDNLVRFFDPKKTILTGNPVRSSIVNLKGTQTTAKQQLGFDENRKLLFVTGGSLGAKGINEGIAAHLPKFREHNIQVLWQVGKFYIDWAKEVVKGYEDTIKVTAFIDSMEVAYVAADAIVSRAGGTISELCIVGKPVILMPSPNVTEDHQTANAMALVVKKAAVMIKDKAAPMELFDAVYELLYNEEKRKQLSHNIKTLAITDAADRIAKEVMALMNKS